jgi:hypothetical protein
MKIREEEEKNPVKYEDHLKITGKTATVQVSILASAGNSFCVTD